MSEPIYPHCTTCTCGRRAPVQADTYGTKNGRCAGTVSWAEHVEAFASYARESSGSSAERMAQRGGFSYGELMHYLGHEPTTWRPVCD